MPNEPWHNDQWFTSPWNYAPEVTKNIHMPPKVRIHDITLRDGEQQAGVVFTKDDKIRIAEKLAEAGVHRIEAGMPAVSPSDEAAVKEIVKRNLGPEIFAFARCMIDDVKRAVDCGVTGVVMEVPSSRHIIEKAYRWELNKAIDLSVQSTRYAHEQGLYVVFFPIDSSRAEIDWWVSLIDQVASDGHMDALAVVDTFGVLSPHAITYLVSKIRERIKQPLEAHFHMDFGMGVANTIMGVAAGIEVIHSTVLGIGERAGNTPMEETVMALQALYNQDLGLRLDKLTELSHLVRDLAGVKVPSNKPVVGDTLYNVESGIISTWVENVGNQDITEVFPYRWEVVGQKPVELVLGKGSGLDSVRHWLKKIGIENASDEDVAAILAKVKAASLESKRLLTEDEFRRLAISVLDAVQS
ncbi:MAG: pyruvate carboxyltransferase [Chloroflexota bacterium]|nr:MAG: pyruvate carboxyltransferase [Chloroflexota bacterium]